MTAKLQFWFLFSLAMSDQLFAGRPVFKHVILEDLILRSHVIAVVQRKDPSFFPILTQKVTKFFKGCAQESWTLDIQDVILLQWKLRDSQADILDEVEQSKSFFPGKTVIALVNETGYEDCLYRLKNPTGASFSATRYMPSNIESSAIGNSFLVFLRLENTELRLATDNSFEDLSQRKNIEFILLKKKADTEDGLPFARVSIDCGPSNIDCASEQHCDQTTGKWYCGEKR